MNARSSCRSAPAALDDRGGWLNRDSADWFADYAQVLFDALDDRVELWTTINEPWVVMDGGYLHGALAPGHRSLFEAPIVLHHLLRAHAAAVAAIRSLRKIIFRPKMTKKPIRPIVKPPTSVMV